MTASPHNIYIHVPYCKSKCRYCAFFSRACAIPDWGAYADGIIKEIHHWRDKLGRVVVPTVFFGGGTPSLMPASVFGRIMDALGAGFDIATDAEITVEANPGTMDGATLREFVSAGLNRLSVGVQSLNDADLRWLGRAHTVRDAMLLIDAAQQLPIKLSADFIYALPGWGAGHVARMCRDINSLGLSHVSMYELTIEPGTPLAQARPEMPDNDVMADMYCAISQTLTLPRYEVSNYAAPGHGCRHNMNVWDGDAYIGLGTGAAGRVLMSGEWFEQTGGADGIFAKMTERERALEKLMTGLRTMRGADKTCLSGILDTDYIRAHPEYITQCGDRLCATERGLLILDDLLVHLTK